jgi:hypothetical protein
MPFYSHQQLVTARHLGHFICELLLFFNCHMLCPFILIRRRYRHAVMGISYEQIFCAAKVSNHSGKRKMFYEH